MSNITINLMGLTWDQYQTIQEALSKAHSATGLPISRYSDLFNAIHDNARDQLWEAHHRGKL